MNAVTGLSSPTSLVGLRPLERAHGDWHRRVWHATPDGARLPWGASVSQVLQTSLIELQMPRGPGDRARMAGERSIGRLTEELCGHEVALVYGAEDEERLQVVLDGAAHPRTGKLISRKQQRRILARRRACAEAIRRLHGAPPLAPGTRRRHRRSSPQSRPVAAWHIQRLIPHLKATLVVALVLAAGAGLLSGEILGLRSSDFNWTKRRVRVSPGSARGRSGRPATRWVYPAAWAWAILEKLVPQGGPDRLLFPGRTPGRPLKRLDRSLKRACRRAFGEGGGTITLLDARGFHQEAMERLGLPRQVVAGSVRTAEPKTARRTTILGWQKRQAAAAHAWVQLEFPPILGGVVPVRESGSTGSAPVVPVGQPAVPPRPARRLYYSPLGLKARLAAEAAAEARARAEGVAPAPSGRRFAPLGTEPSPRSPAPPTSPTAALEPPPPRERPANNRAREARVAAAAYEQGARHGRFETGAAWCAWELLRLKLGHELDFDGMQEEFPGVPDALPALLRGVTAPVAAQPASSAAPVPSHEVDSVDAYSYLTGW